MRVRKANDEQEEASTMGLIPVLVTLESQDGRLRETLRGSVDVCEEHQIVFDTADARGSIRLEASCTSVSLHLSQHAPYVLTAVCSDAGSYPGGPR